jgi:hypothetical protein
MEKKQIVGKIYRFGIVTDMEGNIMFPSINIEGVEVAKSALADWIWQGCKYMSEELSSLDDSCKARKFFLKRTLTDALTIHGKLIGKSDEEITNTLEDWFNE